MSVLDTYKALEEELANRSRVRQERRVPEDWEGWLRAMFPRFVTHPFHEGQRELWDWVWGIKAGVRPTPLVAAWGRGLGKSTTAELACTALACKGTRRYAIYLCDTQDQADDHVANVGGTLESEAAATHYPRVASRMLGKYGHSRGWRRNRLRCASGFTLDALGFDAAARGAKIDEDRPDLLIVDDADEELDSLATVEKKLTLLTKTFLPAGADDLATLVIQNLVHPDGIVSRLFNMSEFKADLLLDRRLSGPFPLVKDCVIEQVDGQKLITHGTAFWEGLSLDKCQQKLTDMGESGFLAECQNDLSSPKGGMWEGYDFQRIAWEQLPALSVIEVWVDPAVTDKPESDSQGVQASGLGVDGKIYTLFSWEQRSSPQTALRTAILKAIELKAQVVGVETDQGGDTWRSVYNEACEQIVKEGHVTLSDLPGFREEKAGTVGAPKAHRASQMLSDYERGKVVHVLGTHATLERALRRVYVMKPFDLVDAAYWCWFSLQRQRATNFSAGFGIYECANCHTKFLWEASKRCPACGTVSPASLS